MIKKIILISLLCLFLIRPVAIFSQNNPPAEDSPTTEEAERPGFFQTILKAISDFFGYLIFGTDYISKPYEPPATYNTSKIANDYTSEYNDYSSRAMPESVRTRRKGVYFYEVMFTNKYNDLSIKGIQTSSNNKEDCPHDISISDIVCFYSQKYQSGQLSDKILYERGSDKPTDYSRVHGCHALNNIDKCYLNAYQNYQDIPQGEFYGKEDTANVASTQLNESIRTLIPENRHGETAPTDNNTRAKVKALVEDSDKQEETMLLNLIPEEIHDDIICDDNANKNRANLRDSFKCHLTEYKKGNTDCGLGQGEYKGGCGEEGVKWIKNGHGISQHGARGLALHGYNYFQIWQKYIGENIEIKTVDGNDAKNITVILIENKDLNNNGVLDNDPNCESLIAHNEASLYNKWDEKLELGYGGVYEDNTPCEYIDVTPISDPNDPNASNIPVKKKYQIKPKVGGEMKEIYRDKCFSAITLPVEQYLLGIAEDPFMWSIESLKALVIAFRQEVFNKGHTKSADGPSVFQCMRVIENRKLPPEKYQGGDFPPRVTNQRAAVMLTKDEIIFRKNTNIPHNEVMHLTAFCGPGGSNPSFNGLEYELLSRGYGWYTNSSVNGICFEGISYLNGRGGTLGIISDNSIKSQDTPETLSPQSQTITASLSNNLYYFNTPTRQSPIKENYDLADVDSGKWLAQFPNSDNCQLDSRVFPALTSLTEKLAQEIPTTSLIPKNCYRNHETQNELWIQGLDKYKDTYTNLMWHSYPGTSIHQTGRVIDFYDQNGRLNSSSPSYLWLLKNGSTYGFYHYKLEPWHWEYNP